MWQRCQISAKMRKNVVDNCLYKSRSKTQKGENTNACFLLSRMGLYEIIYCSRHKLFSFLVFGVDYVMACVDKNSIKGLGNKNYYVNDVSSPEWMWGGIVNKKWKRWCCTEYQEENSPKRKHNLCLEKWLM